ncbi:DUF4157 domain-containing protein [Nostoc sp. FACHB-280]|uniref:eCIS core domain-containing protein n=1 Tax=Nostoc sp. FACHB-280 TaxID=2692839 RepID=UPI00168BE762|nr:DUF4157 domain-containing protein [Nostoc sp. FACHB-280]MBD2497088.1 DUF4157 domain-containing protein [Nostoc sp. FACHB-280]
MYKRQTSKGKSSTNHDAPANQFAPRRFVIQPQTEEAEQTPADLQAKSPTTPGNNLANIPIFPPGYQPPPPPRIQMKLSIGEPGDKYEQEADKLAKDVVQRINSSETPPVQAQSQPEEEDKLRAKPIMQRLSVGGGMAATSDLETSIQQARGSGQPLTESIREPMETAFGADFSGVKIHTDAQSDQLNQSIQAKAFTTGQDVFFRQGEYQPETRGGQELLAHELTHVVQQNGKTLQKTSDINSILSTAKAEVQQKTAINTIQRYLMTDEQRQEVYTNMAKSKVAKGYGQFFKKGGRAYLETWLTKNEAYTKNVNYDDEDINLIIEVYEKYEKVIGFLSFNEFVDLLAEVGGKALTYATTMKELKFKNQPSIVFGFCLTQANYDSAKNVIVVDPFRVKDDLEALDAALFECMNALQRDEMRANFKIPEDAERGLAIAKQEFKSECMYITQLKNINDASNLDELVAKLGIDKMYLETVSFDNCKEGGVPMPDRSILSRQDARTALWHYKTKDWAEKDREYVWVRANHGEGVASSMELYAH